MISGSIQGMKSNNPPFRCFYSEKRQKNNERNRWSPVESNKGLSCTLTLRRVLEKLSWSLVVLLSYLGIVAETIHFSLADARIKKEKENVCPETS